MFARRCHKALLFAVVAALLLSGCAGSVKPTDVSKEDIARLQALAPEEAIKSVEGKYAAAQQQALQFYAPGHFRAAEQALAAARALLAKKGDEKEIATQLAIAEERLRLGAAVKETVTRQLKDELRLKTALEQAEAHVNFQREYQGVIDDLSDLIRLIEEGKGEKLGKARNALQGDMRRLETKAIKYQHMHVAETTLESAKAKGAEKLAPLTFNKAVEAYQHADTYIQENPHKTESVTRLGKQATFAAKHALHVTEAVAVMSTRVKSSVEQVILDEEDRLLRISKALAHEDVRDRPLQQQAIDLAKAAEAAHGAVAQAAALGEEKATLNQQLAELRQSGNDQDARLAELQGEMEKLKQELAQALEQKAGLEARLTALQAETAPASGGETEEADGASGGETEEADGAGGDAATEETPPPPQEPTADAPPQAPGETAPQAQDETPPGTETAPATEEPAASAAGQ